ncbi:nuclear transport factor 2 family protein [uncultured Psychroserpens sp.]|uniref:nuclear transport factor 2 family protein n=1 Tax=uncultured Psychroserpens sp. TaxID=255436 RepID=UPI002619903F|nr:nuclear transport factor 2 family protein [uncultured Psychroserpens sp.]
MRYLLKIVTISCLLTAVSCNEPKTITEKQSIEVADDVKQTLNSYFDDIRESGLTAEFKYLDNSKAFFWTPPGFASSISYDSVVTILKQSAPRYQSIDNQWDVLKINPLTKEFATYTGKLSSIVIDTSGQVFKVKLVETGVVVKRHDGWKLLCGQTSTISD